MNRAKIKEEYEITVWDSDRIFLNVGEENNVYVIRTWDVRNNYIA